MKPEYDFGHQENLFGLKHAWLFRSRYRKLIKPTASSKPFWRNAEKHFKFRRGSNHIRISDSHLSVLKALDGIDHVVLMDAHHDCFVSDPSYNMTDCGNWGVFWLAGSEHRTITWVYPEWLPGNWGKDIWDSMDPAVRGRVNVLRLRDLKLTPIDRIHACRSGCWTPPWCDPMWFSFILSSGRSYKTMDKEPWDGLRCRWQKADYEYAEAVVRCEEQAIQSHKELGTSKLYFP